MRRLLLCVLVALVLVALALGPTSAGASAGACTNTYSSGNPATLLQNAPANAVVCLTAAGSPYGSLSTNMNFSSSAGKTLRASPSADVTVQALQFTFQDAGYFYGMTLKGGATTGPTTHTV